MTTSDNASSFELFYGASNFRRMNSLLSIATVTDQHINLRVCLQLDWGEMSVSTEHPFNLHLNNSTNEKRYELSTIPICALPSIDLFLCTVY